MVLKNLTGSAAFLNELLEVSRLAALEEMASGIAHELTQPLAAIATFSHAGERMLNRPDPLVARALDVFNQIAHEALSAGERLQTIRRLFEQARGEQTRCKLSDLVIEMRPVLNDLALQADAILRFEAPEDLPDVQIDRSRVGHVLLALVKNAADASAALCTERSIDIDMHADRYTIETGVSDLGGGVPPELEGKLFRPFFTTKPRGAGLGLASSRAIVESQEGSIGYQHLSSGGARFWFRLPIAQG
jgi:C4-dicarboxylate-specific signal transduction histidine kinase